MFFFVFSGSCFVQFRHFWVWKLLPTISFQLFSVLYSLVTVVSRVIIISGLILYEVTFLDILAESVLLPTCVQKPSVDHSWFICVSLRVSSYLSIDTLTRKEKTKSPPTMLLILQRGHPIRYSHTFLLITHTHTLLYVPWNQFFKPHRQNLHGIYLFCFYYRVMGTLYWFYWLTGSINKWWLIALNLLNSWYSFTHPHTSYLYTTICVHLKLV